MATKEYKQLMLSITALSLQHTQNKLKNLEIDNIDIMVLIDVIERLDLAITTLKKLSK